MMDIKVEAYKHVHQILFKTLPTSHTNFNFLKVRPFVLDVTGVGTLL